MQSNLSFIILHFKNSNDTIGCVESIIETNLDNNKIFIVDNGSNDNSLELIKDKFKDKEYIYFIKNSENLGFAKGFNKGIEFAKKIYPNNFFVLLNSDTEIKSKNWSRIIYDKYNKYHFDVLGPDIVNMDGVTHVNPRKTGKYTFLNLNIKIIIKYVEYILLNFGFDVIAYVIKRRNNNANDNDEMLVEKVNVELQGSCFIFSPKYISIYKGLYDKTFLYYEESILKYIVDRDNLCSLFTPELKILHKEYGSTMEIVNTEKKKRLFILKHGIKSRKILRNQIMSDNFKRLLCK
jgi:GT2 family glycosyltransferase